MNRVLERQLRRLGLGPDEAPDAAGWAAFLERVGAFYDEADRVRYVLERSMEVSAREMRDLNEEIKALSERRLHRTEELSRHNFQELPVAAWLEDFQQVVARLEDLRASGVEDLGDYLDREPEALRDLIERVEVIDCNPAVLDLLGADRAAVLGMVDASTLGAASLGSWRRQFEAIWFGDGRVEVEFTGQRGDGSSFAAILQWSAAEIDGVRDYSRVMVVVIDITERIATEEKMRRLVVAKDEFLAAVSHELRTPLTSVLGYASLLLDDDVEPGERRSMLATIAEQAADLANIVEDLLAGARSDLGQLEVRLEDVPVTELVDACVTACPDAEWIGEDVTRLTVEGDPARVRQILRNLITNAERYGGQQIAIHAGLRGDGFVEIAVCDDGPEIEAGTSGRVFERYYRQRGERSRTGSVGLGLTISRDLARLMGGDLTYRHDGTWGRFVLTLPQPRQLRAVG